MKAHFFVSARLNLPGLCMIAALAAACSFDTSQLRALGSSALDGAVEHPAVPDAPITTGGSDGPAAGALDAPNATGGSDGSIATRPDAPIATGGADGSAASAFDAPTAPGGSGGTTTSPPDAPTIAGGNGGYAGVSGTGGAGRSGSQTAAGGTGGTGAVGGSAGTDAGAAGSSGGGSGGYAGVSGTGGAGRSGSQTAAGGTGGTAGADAGVAGAGGSLAGRSGSGGGGSGGTSGSATGGAGATGGSGGSSATTTPPPDGATTTCTPVPKSTGGISCPGGFCTVGSYSGYDVSFADPTGKSSVCVSAGGLCGAGVVGAQDPPAYTVWGAGFGFNLSPQTAGTTSVPVQLSGSSVTVKLSSLPTGADMRVQVSVNGVAYCAVMTMASQTILWNAFNTKCWAPTTGTALTGPPSTPNIQFQASSRATAGSFDFCVTALSFQ